MSFNSSRDARIAVGSGALAAYLRSVQTTTTVDTADATTLTDTTKTYLPTLTEAQVACSGFFEPLGYEDTVAAVFGADSGSPVTVAAAGLAAGNPVTVFAARAISRDINAAVGEVVGLDATFQCDGRFDVGVSLADLAEVSATGNGTSQAAAAGTSNGGVATLHVTACSGTLIVKVQHSTNGTAWSDLVTFTTATGATSQRVEVNGSVNKYLRASWSLTGTGATATLTTSFARR